MASSAPDVAQSSRAGQEADQELESEPQRKWVALVSVAILLGNDDERAKEIPVGTDVLLDLNDPPLPSYLYVLHPRVATHPRRNDQPLSAHILAADRSGCILLHVVEGNHSEFILCNTNKRTVTILPAVSSDVQVRGLDMRPHLSIGLIADPHHPGEYVAVQLNPTTSNNHPNRLLCYSTAEDRWFTMQLTRARQQVRMSILSSETDVLAHDGSLWWLALAGVFFCNPFTHLADSPELRFLPLPPACETMEGDAAAFDSRIWTLNQRRCLRRSEGKLRFVDIRYDEVVEVPAATPTVRMWTLDDPEGPDAWTFEYEVAFAEIWKNKAYIDAGLLPNEVPHVALVDPNDHCVIYFFQGSKLFGFDMREKTVVACNECHLDELMSQSSRPTVDTWELPPPPPTFPGVHNASPDDNVFDTMEFALAQSGMGLLCRRQAFCSICRLPICLSCCPSHKISHHGPDPGAIVTIYMTKDGAAVDAREIKINGMGYNWQFIQRKMHAGQKCIVLRDPEQDGRNKADCLECGHKVKSKSRYCSPACKILHRPNGHNNDIVQALVNSDFDQCAVRDRFCITCRKGFASAHCANHEVHNHAGAAAPVPPAEAPPVPAVVPLMLHDGWMLLPEHLLQIAGGIQRVNLEQQVMFALRKRDAPPVGQASGNPCGNLGCSEYIQPPAEACSFKCWLVLHPLLPPED